MIIETSPQTFIMLNSRAFFHSRGAMKIIQVILGVICLILLRRYNLSFGESGSQDRYIVGLVTLGGMLLVSAPLLLVYIRNPAVIQDNYTPAFLEAIYNSVGFLLYLTVGCLTLTYYDGKLASNNSPGVALGALSVANSMFYLVDAALAITQNIKM